MPLLLLFFVLTIYMSFRKNETPIQLIQDVVDYFEIRIIQSFRKTEKKIFHHHFKNFIVTSKVIEKSSKDGNGILSEQSYSVEAPKRPEATGSNSVQVHQFFGTRLSNLNMELLNVPLFFRNNLKKRKTKRAVKRTPEFSK